jgi:hypothetical protein
LFLSIIAPVFVAPAPALAADMYTIVKSASVNPDSNTLGIGAVVKVTIPDIAIASGSRVTVSMPSEWTFSNKSGVTAMDTYGSVAVSNGSVTDSMTIVAGGDASITGSDADDTALATSAFVSTGGFIPIKPNKTFDIQLKADGSVGANRYFYIYFNGIDVHNYTGDLSVTFVQPQGSVFQLATINLGTSSRNGSTMTSIKKVNSLTSPGGTLDIITVMELQAGTITQGEKIKLKIQTKGVEWDSDAIGGSSLASYTWDWEATGNDPLTSTNTTLSPDGKELSYKVKTANTNEPGRISFVNLPIYIDDSEATPGDTIKVKISGADMTDATIEVAKYGEVGLSFTDDGTATEIIAGHDDQDLGTFTIHESAPGSWVKGRTVKLTLPSGVKWNDTGDIDITNSGDIATPTIDVNDDDSSDCDVLTYNLEGTDPQSDTDASDININDLTVDVAPDFTGDVNVKISGTAGLSGEIKLATVKPAVSITVASDLKTISLGQANQAIGDITLTEGIAEGLYDNQDLILRVDDGYRWSKEPTVKVTEGDLDIDEDGVKISGDGDRDLIIPIDSQSSVASKIVISDAYIDAERVAPEGPVYLKIVNSGDTGGSAIMSDEYKKADAYGWEDKDGDKEAIAICGTPAQTVGHNASFYIGSNIMNVNGSNIIMDVAPYIKSGRTYIPVRFLGDALGATTAWDAATQTVTVTKGDKTVVLVIGSKTAKVNGADVAMDVAPEIVNGRTMLPARYVAEGLGFSVGWNAALQQVVIQ